VSKEKELKSIVSRDDSVLWRSLYLRRVNLKVIIETKILLVDSIHDVSETASASVLR
jgi:hypothetical protein